MSMNKIMLILFSVNLNYEKSLLTSTVSMGDLYSRVPYPWEIHTLEYCIFWKSVLRGKISMGNLYSPFTRVRIFDKYK